MSRNARDRERDRFSTDTDRWGAKAALLFFALIALVPVWMLLDWLLGLL